MDRSPEKGSDMGQRNRAAAEGHRGSEGRLGTWEGHLSQAGGGLGQPGKPAPGRSTPELGLRGAQVRAAGMHFRQTWLCASNLEAVVLCF